MTTALIIGSGTAAAGAALALSRRSKLQITVVDIGLQLESERQHLVTELAADSPEDWDIQTLRKLSTGPRQADRSRIPEKRVFGSNFPFRNVGQLDRVSIMGAEEASLISPAYGGFSNVWGSQLMPFTDRAFEAWPVSAAVMRVHYQDILGQIPFAGEHDDLALRFPLMRSPAALPPMSSRSLRVLNSYEHHRTRLNARGITIGKARLALEASNCNQCGLCMTGCPYGLIYSAAQTFDTLRRCKRITYHPGLLALKIEENRYKATVIAKELASEQVYQFEADRVYIACGALGTTRLVANSFGMFDRHLSMLESRQFVIPTLSARPTGDPRQEANFTLNQFNMIVEPGGDASDLSTLHFYTFNPAFVDALPSPLRARRAQLLQEQVLRRLTVAFGYLPSWRSPRLRVTMGPPARQLGLPELRISSEAAPHGQGRMLGAVIHRLARSARMLDLYPLVPMMRLSASGKSYHWGGSFPHVNGQSTTFSSDLFGRVGPWQRIHLVDASVFPTVPAMTYGLTIMANAHRIASDSLELPE